MDIREPEVDAKMFYDDALSPLCSHRGLCQEMWSLCLFVTPGSQRCLILSYNLCNINVSLTNAGSVIV